jgi:hypothetical protein
VCHPEYPTDPEDDLGPSTLASRGPSLALNEEILFVVNPEGLGFVEPGGK